MRICNDGWTSVQVFLAVWFAPNTSAGASIEVGRETGFLWLDSGSQELRRQWRKAFLTSSSCVDRMLWVLNMILVELLRTCLLFPVDILFQTRGFVAFS